MRTMEIIGVKLYFLGDCSIQVHSQQPRRAGGDPGGLRSVQRPSSRQPVPERQRRHHTYPARDVLLHLWLPGPL